MRRALSLLAAVVLVVGALAALAAAYLHFRMSAPGPRTEAVAVVIPKGAGSDAIAERLRAAGVIADAGLFKLAAKLEARRRPLRAGEFEFPARVSLAGALAILQSAKPVVRRLTVAEGLTVAQVMAQLEATEGLDGAVGDWPAEGALLPETYHFSWGDARAGVIGRMTRAMRETLAALWPGRTVGAELKTPGEALILASIVEKETALPAERARIAAVFLNRLKAGMRLQSDPTVAYALTRGRDALGRPLARADLQLESPYNTYVRAGLPPGPIANPGRAALEAVLMPSASDELYFVADGSGGHVFAKTLDEHNRNVAKWRKFQRDGEKGETKEPGQSRRP